MDLHKLKMMAFDSLPLDITRSKAGFDDDWGSERQINAQNAFFIAVEKIITEQAFSDLEDWCLKATCEEMLEYAMKVVVDPTKQKKFRCVWGDGYVDSTKANPTVQMEDMFFFNNDIGYDDDAIEKIDALEVGEKAILDDLSGDHYVERTV